MKRLTTAARKLIELKAQHRKGFYAHKQRPEDAAKHALEEVAELIGSLKHESYSDQMTKMGDVLACLAFVCVQADFDLDCVIDCAVGKLAARYGLSRADLEESERRHNG